MLELIVIIWLSIGLLLSLSTFAITMYKANYIIFTLADLLNLVTTVFTGPMFGIYLLLGLFVDVEDVEIFTHHRDK